MKQRSGKAAVVDVYLSEEGIEDVQVSIIQGNADLISTSLEMWKKILCRLQ